MPNPRRIALVLCLTAATATGGSVASIAQGPSLPAARAADAAPRYLSWIAIGYVPTDAELRDAAGRYDTIVLNADRAAVATRMKQLDPAVRVLAYEDLASVRTYDGSRAVVTGVSYTTARDRGWLATDTSGRTIEWNGYAGHLQAAVWNADYRSEWTKNVTAALAGSPFDGVYADNDMSSLKYYSSAVVSGTRDQAGTDALVRQGTDALIDEAGPALNAQGKSLVVNISDGRLDEGRWDRHSRYGGGQEENFMSWSMSDWHPNVYDWGTTGWTTQTGLMARGPKSLAVTNTAPGDNRTMTYGYASFLMQADPGDAWTSRDSTGYNSAKLPAETRTWLGRPESKAWQENGVWLRYFQGGMVIVNPQTTDKTFTAPPSALDSNGNALGTIQLPAMTARIARWR